MLLKINIIIDMKRKEEPISPHIKEILILIDTKMTLEQQKERNMIKEKKKKRKSSKKN